MGYIKVELFHMFPIILGFAILENKPEIEWRIRE